MTTGIESLSELMDRVRRFTDQTSIDLYDLLPIEDREAIEYVRERIGLESVKSLLGWVVSHCSTSQQLDFDFWFSGRVMHELGFEEDVADRDEVERRLLARLMPEGMEWPRFEDGRQVKFRDEGVDVHGETRSVEGVKFSQNGFVFISDGMGVTWWANDRGPIEEAEVDPGKRVKRPERKDSRLDGCCHPGSYKCDEFAFYDQDRGKCVFADKCLVPELRKLRESGIRTIASCCGHGTMRPSIVVAPECEDEMRQQGYEGRRNKFGVLEFTAKSECHAPKVLDADGADIRVSDTVRINGFDEEYTVVGFDIDRGGRLRVKCEPLGGMSTSYLFPEQITVVDRPEPKVPAADGNEIRAGEMVYSTETGVEFTVISVNPVSRDVHVRWGYDFEEKTGTIAAELLTHERPETDSWERLEEDASLPPYDYCDRHGLLGEDIPTAENFARDLVRRAKALAERGWYWPRYCARCGAKVIVRGES